MKLRTLAAFLVGDREAILALAGDPRALWVGMFMVLSAGFAREYDAEYLLAEPWHLLIPFGGSLLASFLLHALVHFVGRWEERPAFFASYRRFLTLFWLTAPLAWAYAIPYERFLDDLGAVQANLLTLLVVALWRVLLTIRIVSVLYGAPWTRALHPVLLFSDTLALIGVQAVPFPLIAIMGGVRLEPGEAALQAVAGQVLCLGAMTWPIWFIGSLAAAVRAGRVPWTLPALAPAEVPARRPWAPVLLTCGVLGGLACAMNWTQREQALRHEFGVALAEGGLPAALDVLEGHQEHELPPHWGLPRVWARVHLHGAFRGPEALPELTRFLEALQGRPAWIRERYLARAETALVTSLWDLLRSEPPKLSRPAEERDTELAFLRALAGVRPAPRLERAIARELGPEIAHFLTKCEAAPGLDPRFAEVARSLFQESSD